MKTKEVYSNCLMGVLYLFLRGRVAKVVAVDTQSIWWPHHYVVLTKKGHVLHFNHSRPHARNTFAPWWFEGSFEGIRKSKIQEELEKNKRNVQYQTEKVWIGFMVLLLLYMLLFFPFMICWSVFPLFWCGKGSVHAFYRKAKVKTYIR